MDVRMEEDSFEPFAVEKEFAKVFWNGQESLKDMAEDWRFVNGCAHCWTIKSWSSTRTSSSCVVSTAMNELSELIDWF